MLIPLLPLLPLLLLFSLASATFDPSTLPQGSFRLIFGLTICPDLISFTQPGLTHPASTLFFDTRPISGGTLNLFPNPPRGGSGFIRHFSVHPDVVGTYYAGLLTSRVQWDTSALGTDTAFVFFTPEVTFRTTWEDVIGKRQPLETVSGVPVYWFEEDVDYIVINNRCLLRRETGRAGASNGAAGTESSGCFPADAFVTTPHGDKRIDTVNTGDFVWTGRQFSEIFLWTHRNPFIWAKHMTLVLSNDKRLTLTPGHFVYLNNNTVPARNVRIGDTMTTDAGEATVVKVVNNVFVRGLYNPQTKDGDIVVDGVRITTFTTAVPPFVAHALLTPVRVAFDMYRFARRTTNMIS